MSVIISVNEKNIIRKKDNGGRKSVIQTRKQIVDSLNYVAYSKADSESIPGDMVILVGRKNKGDAKIKAVPIPFMTDDEHKLYHWKEDSSSGTRVSLPPNKQEVFQFTGPVRVYTNGGFMMTLKAEDSDKVAVFRTENLLLVRIGESGNKIAKERKSKQLAQMGIWKA